MASRIHALRTAAPFATAALHWLWRELRVGVPLCLGVAVFLAIVFDAPLGHNIVYSLCIGLAIQFSIEAGRHGITAWQRRRSPSGAPGTAWPGWAAMGPWVVVSVVGGYWAGAWLGDVLTGAQRHGELLSAPPRALAAVLLVVLGIALATTYYFYSRGRLASIEAQAETARRSAAEMQLRMLQSQLEPHMLFNTLANLRVLVGTDAVRAQRMLDQLIAFLRATLQASRGSAHPLAVEFERLGDYLALMQVRMGARLSVSLDLPEPLRRVPVPPLLLQPLVENAIRHGLEPQPEGGRIAVRAERRGNRLRLTVRDTGAGLGRAPASDGGGLGIRLVRERLAALYGGLASLDVEPGDDDGGGALASVELPLSDDFGAGGTAEPSASA